MAYIPDPTNVTEPLDGRDAGTAAAEFRALKAYIAGLAGLATGMNIFRRNLAINGCFRFDQLREGAVANSGGATVQGPDMWSANDSAGAGRIGIQKEIDPDYTGEFNLLITVPTADAAIAAGDNYFVYTTIEGQDVAFLHQGNAAALPITVSFEVKSSIVGTFCISIRNSALNRSYVGEFTVLLANTVERKTLTLTPDLAGVWLADTGIGMYVGICLAAGATFQTPAGAWAAGNFTATVNQTNFMSNVANTMRIKRFQVEQANAASPFERRIFVHEHMLVSRYYCKTFNLGTAPVQAAGGSTGEFYISIVNASGSFGGEYCYPVPMRAVPTATTFNPVSANANARDESAALDCIAISVSTVQKRRSAFVNIQGNAGSAQGNLAGIHLTFNARLS